MSFLYYIIYLEGEGSMGDEKINVYKKGNGRFEARYFYGYKPNGTIRYKSVSGKTYEETLKKCKEEINKKILANDLLIYNKDYLGYYIYKWLRSVKIRCKKSTYSSYHYTVKSRIIPMFAKIKKKDLDLDLIDNYTEELLEEGLCPKTVKDILVILEQIFKVTGVSIKVSMPKVPRKDIQIIKPFEQVLLEKELLTNLDLISFGIYFCLYTGLRIGEICALRWENIDIKNKKIKVKKTIVRIKNPDVNAKKKTIVVIDQPKSISSIREIPIPDFMITFLLKFSEGRGPDDFLITGTNKYMETRTYFNRYKKIVKEIGLDHYNFHALRHTFATRCIEKGCDPKTLSEILGHSNVNITLQRYVHPGYESKVKVINQLNPMYDV